MAKLTNVEFMRLALKIGKTERYLEKGMSIPDIAKKLKVGESTVRSWVDKINKAKENEEKLSK